MPQDSADPLIWRAYPHFDVFLFATSVIAAGAAYPADVVSSAVLIGIAATMLVAGQVLMPAINAATDTRDRRRIKTLHTAPVAITLAQIVAAGFVVVRIAKGL